MEFITVVIARLVGDEPMPSMRWIRFRRDVARVLRQVAGATTPPGWWLEISSSTTRWAGREEPAATFTLMGVSVDLTPVIRENLKDLPARYEQEAISIRYGTAELIT